MNELQPNFRVNYSGLNVLVTGADGFIGSHLTETLTSNGAKVTALALYNSFDSHGWLDDLPRAARSKLRLVRGDVCDSAFVHRLMKRQDIVFHLAALIAIPHSYVAAQSYVDTNVLGTLNVLEAARENDVLRVVHTSTSEVYGTALTTPITESHPLQGQSPYSASKIGADMMAEAFARSFDLRVAILRPFNTFGPRQSERAVIPTILRQALDPHCRAIMIGDTTPVRDFTFVEDTAAAFLAVGTRFADRVRSSVQRRQRQLRDGGGVDRFGSRAHGLHKAHRARRRAYAPAQVRSSSPPRGQQPADCSHGLATRDRPARGPETNYRVVARSPRWRATASGQRLRG